MYVVDVRRYARSEHNTETIFTELHGYIGIGTLIEARSLHGASGEFY